MCPDNDFKAPDLRGIRVYTAEEARQRSTRAGRKKMELKRALPPQDEPHGKDQRHAYSIRMLRSQAELYRRAGHGNFSRGVAIGAALVEFVGNTFPELLAKMEYDTAKAARELARQSGQSEDDEWTPNL